MDDENMEHLVLVAIGVLLLVFIGSLVALILICFQRRTYLNRNPFGLDKDDNYLIIGNGGERWKNVFTNNNMELDNVRLHPNIDQILSDTKWAEDANGLIPHCLSILKGCHHLTERLVASTMSAMPRFTDAEQGVKLIEITRIATTISPRVDDVVESITDPQSPLNPRLLESRCLSLLLAVSRLAIVITYTCSIQGKWIDDELKGLEQQLKLLREVGKSMNTTQETSSNDNEPEENN